MFSADQSSVFVDGAPVEALQSLTFRVATERDDISTIGSEFVRPVGTLRVLGEMVVRSTSAVLDGLGKNRARFRIVANLKKDVGMETQATRTIALDECLVVGRSIGMDASGAAAITYAFTATTIREK